MSKRLPLAAALSLSLLAVFPALSRAQNSSPARITVEWQNAELKDVVNAFAKFSGQNIVVAADVHSKTVTFAAHDVEWRSALDAMLEQQSLIAHTDTSCVIHVENRVESSPQRKS